ncbi:MAG: translocation/assembly module TamB domain-containing protein [Sphingobacteriales bacterium]|nr:translocation/assembly module TamB domain-containing protein [Sphingobacteriales bacterium]
MLFNPDEIDFGNLELRDTLNKTATLSGKIYHRFFNDFEFDNIRFQTRRLLVLNTKKKDNNQFYGKVIGRATMLLNGPISNMVMNISGEPSSFIADSNHITLLSGNSRENGNIDYIDFIQFGNKMDDHFTIKSSSNILVDMNLTANPTCKIDMVLDEVTGDIISGRGNGKLNIRVGSIEPLSIRGRYDIAKGEYTFNFQTFLRKYFTVTSGSIVWSGDPFLANIDVTAEYLATGVDLSNLPLVTTITGGSKPKSDVRIVAHLTETLLKPKIGFEFQLPAISQFKNDFAVNKSLDGFKNDENEMNKQVSSVLLFNSFISNNQAFLNAGSGYSVLSNTIGGVISNAISGTFNKLLQKVLNDNTISSYVGINSSLDAASNVNKLQGQGKLGLTKTFLDNRLVVSVGGNLDYNNPYATSAAGKSSNVLVTPDIILEWILTKDGRVRVVAFNQTNYDYIGQRNRTGLKLTYRKDVDNLLNIFKPPAKERAKRRIKKDKIVTLK